MKMRWRRTIIEIGIAVLILVGIAWLMDTRLPSRQERKKMSQSVSANFDNTDLDVALQSLVDQTDGSFSITVCADLKRYKVSLYPGGKIPLSRALEGIAAQIPAHYLPYGMQDVAIVHPMFVCKGGNRLVVAIEKRAPKH
jgi:hypothetical protein